MLLVRAHYAKSIASIPSLGVPYGSDVEFMGLTLKANGSIMVKTMKRH